MRYAKGFTLIELLVVLTILGMLAALVGPQVMKHLGSAKTETAHLQINDLAAALDLYYLEVGRYPTTEEGLEALVRQPAGVEHWNGPYLRRSAVPKDPWGNEYQYRFPGERTAYDLYSFGAEGPSGGDSGQDVVRWE